METIEREINERAERKRKELVILRAVHQAGTMSSVDLVKVYNDNNLWGLGGTPPDNNEIGAAINIHHQLHEHYLGWLNPRTPERDPHYGIWEVTRAGAIHLNSLEKEAESNFGKTKYTLLARTRRPIAISLGFAVFVSGWIEISWMLISVAPILPNSSGWSCLAFLNCIFPVIPAIVGFVMYRLASDLWENTLWLHLNKT